MKSVVLDQRGRFGGVVTAGEIRGDDRAGARAGELDPVRDMVVAVARGVGELLERAGEREALDAAALEDPVGCMLFGQR